ncbi:hypothetical protein DY000_02020340 [Brassica cretica]|uniref:Myb-like domain-containing protein n=1 Tax=Brassica cretica TaxID=69181 RepID=A0ABQ7E6M9_BRACR|nr:hypothetical protein DY000_02020340 [Brassica cretica]
MDPPDKDPDPDTLKLPGYPIHPRPTFSRSSKPTESTQLGGNFVQARILGLSHQGPKRRRHLRRSGQRTNPYARSRATHHRRFHELYHGSTRSSRRSPQTTNDQLAALVAALTAPDGQTSRPQQIRRRLFNTNPTATGRDHVSDDSEPNETLLADTLPVCSDLVTIREIAELKLSFQQMSEKIHQVTSADPQIESVLAATSRTLFISALTICGDGWNKWVRELDSSEKPVNAVCSAQTTTSAECKSLYAHYLSSLASGDFKFEPLKARLKNDKSRSKNKERRAQRKATGKGRHSETQQRDNEEDAPKGNGEGDSSANEEQPANRRRIEVILSQQTLSSDDENDDTPVLEDLRDVLKRKFESEDSNSSTHNDLRTTLDARKSRQDAPRGNGKGDSSADEEQPANRRRIEGILSQQTLSSDDENDDTPVLEDLRDVLKRKFESEDSNSSTHNDLRTTLDARKSRRISTSDPDPNERPNGDLRDKLNAEPRQEPRQHAPIDKNGRKDGYMYVVNENNVPVSTLVVRGEGSNKWVRELDSSDKPVDAVCSTQTTTAAGSAAQPFRTVDLTKHCKYHHVKGHYTAECKSLYAHYLSSLASGDFKFEPLKARPKNGKSWSRNKERRAQRKATGKGRHSETQQRDDKEDAPKSNGEGDSSADKEQPANHRRIEVILSPQTLSSDNENDDTPVLEDLRDVLAYLNR